MSGHNKWSKIKNKKAATDAKKSKSFSMFAKMIAVESRKAKGDKNSPSLRAVMERARGANMPNDNIERAVTKGAGSDGGNLEEVLYEAYGPGGVALIIEGITDNKNRTTPEIRHLLATHSGSLGASGSALWAFSKTDEGWTAENLLDLSDSDEEALLKLLEALDDHDDVQNISTNANLENPNIIIGIDPGYDRLGIAIIEKQNPKERLLFSDCIQTSSKLSFSERLTTIGQTLEQLLHEYQPGLVALEKLFVTNNQKTAMMVGEVRGALMYVIGCHHIPLVEYTPSEIKLTVTGSGTADKQQVTTMVKHLITIEKPIKLDDEFDAIAIALTASAKERF